MIDGLALMRGDHKAAAGAEIDRAPVNDIRRRVPGGNEGEIEIGMIQRAAGIPGVDLVDSLPSDMRGEFVHDE